MLPNPKENVCFRRRIPIYGCMIASKGIFLKKPCKPEVIFSTSPRGGCMTCCTYGICSSAATRRLIRSERGIELSQYEDMTSSAHSTSMMGRLTCGSGTVPGISLWALNAASEQRPTTQMTSGGNPSPVA